MDANESRQKAWFYHNTRQWAKAEAQYRRLIEDWEDSRDITNLGALLRAQGRSKEGCEVYAKYIKKHEPDDVLLVNAVNCANEAERAEDALYWLSNALRKGEGSEKVREALGRTYMALGRHGEAIKVYEVLEKVDVETRTRVGVQLGICYQMMGDLDRSVREYDNVLREDKTNVHAATNLITLLADYFQGHKDTEKIVTRVIQTAGHFHAVQSAVGYLRMRQGYLEEASRIFTHQCCRKENVVNDWINLAGCLYRMKLLNRSRKVRESAMLLYPNDRDLGMAMAQNMAEIGNKKRASEIMLSYADEMIQRGNDTYFYNLQYIGSAYKEIQIEELAIRAREWEEKKKQDKPTNIWADRMRIKKDRLKVLYMSADFNSHPVGRFMLPILKRHNRERFSIGLISCGTTSDEVTEELVGLADTVVDISRLKDLEAARVISDLQADVLVELSGYTAGSRLGVLTYKPCRVQLSYLGYFCDTFLKSIDGWIGDDELFSRVGDLATGTPRISIKGGYMAFEEKRLPEIEVKREDGFVFGCFNNSRKLCDRTIMLFSRVLKSCPGARLVLKSISFQEEEESQRIRRLFGKFGIRDTHIITLQKAENTIEHLRMYNVMDVSLDPIPYGGATTTCESLAMGVPVVALEGEGMVGCLSKSILVHSGLAEYVAKSEEEYIGIARELASQGRRQERIRMELRRKFLSSPACNVSRLTEELERVYENAAK